MHYHKQCVSSKSTRLNNWVFSRIASLAALLLLVLGVSTARAFNHPGILSPLSDLDFIKTNLNNEPWHSAFVALTNDSYASLTYQMQGPFGVVARDTGVSTNLAQWQNDISAAYEQSVLWYLTGNQSYANNAMNIYNAWSQTLTNFGGNNAQLGANTVYIACAGAEILRYTGAGWSAAGIGQFEGMLTNVFVPVCAPYGVANWGGGAVQAMMSIGVFCDDTNIFNSAMVEFQTATYYPPNRDSDIEYISQSGQNQESGRDQVHTIMAMEALAGTAEILFDQGYDGWGYGGNRILAGYEYWSKYNLGYNNLPFDLGIYSNESPWSGMSATSRGINGSPGNYDGVDSGSVLVQRAYARKGIGMQYTSEINNMIKPYKNLGWGNLKAMDTLLFSYEPITVPALPGDVYGLLTDVDIGNPTFAGSATYTPATTNWSVTGGGSDIWGTNDQFNFDYTNVPMNSTIATYVTSVQNVNSSAKAGVMLRETLAANAAMGEVSVLPSGNVEFIYRTSTGASCAAASVSGIYAPCWVKLVGASTSAGGPFQYMTAYYSKDGINWSVVGQIAQITMGTNAYAGLLVCAHTTSATCAANFQSTRLGASPINTPPVGPSAPTGLTATAQQLGQVALSWNAVSGATSYNIYNSTTSGGPYLTAVYGVTNTSYTDGLMIPNKTYYYTVTALNSAGGESGYSAEASVTPTVPVIAGTTITLSSTQPTVEANAIAQLDYSGGVHSGNNYTDHGVAESFTTSGNATGYDLTALVFKGAGSTSATSGQQLTVRINKLNGPTEMMPVAQTTASWSFSQNDASWVTINLGSPVHLDPNTVYEFDARETGPAGTWYGVAVGTNLPAGVGAPYPYSGNPYTNGWGSFLSMPTTNLATLYFSPHGYNQTFIAQMTASAGAGPAAPTGLSAVGGNLAVNLNWTQSTSPGITGNNVYRSLSSGGPYSLLANLAATTSYSDTAVSAGSTYYYSVTAVNANGESALSAYAGATTIPPVPTGLSATPGNNQVYLTWNASSGATGYNVYRSTVSGGTYTQIASGVTTANYTDATPVNGTTYYYVVTAANTGGESAFSSEVSATPLALWVISVNFQGGSTQNGTPSPMAATEYAGQVAVDNWNNASGVSGTVSALLQNDSTATTASVTWSCNNTWSTPIAESPDNYRMMKGYLDTSSSSTTTVNVSGLPAAYTANGYSVYVYCDGDNSTSTKTGVYSIGSVTNSATDTGGVNFSGTFVQANNSAGNYVVFTNQTATSFTLLSSGSPADGSGARSPVNAIQIVANVSTGVPAVPTGLTAVAGNAQVTLGWTASTGVTSYNVKRATVSGGPYTTIAGGVATASYTDATAVNGTTYYYVVSAVNGSGESANSSEVSAKPQAPAAPVAPTNLAASAGRRKISLTWTQSTSGNITGNNVYRSTVNGGPYSRVSSLAATTSYTDTGLTSGRTYYYVVTAVNSSNLESSYSTQASATSK
jgi:fibronectin type 3 domain-containing protein